MAKIPGQKPRYQLLHDELLQQIQNGQYKPGDLLPSENELKKTYGITQPVIRQALLLLQQEGLVKTQQGKGSIVQPRPKGIGILSIEGFSVTSQDDHQDIQTIVTEKPKIIQWPEDMYYEPGKKEADAGCIKLERRRSVASDIIFYEKLLFPDIDMPGFLNLQMDNRSLYATLKKKYNIQVSSCEKKFWALAADETIASFLSITKGAPVLRLERRFETNRTGFNIYSSLYANTEKYYLYGNS